jgi:hypothetical protein
MQRLSLLLILCLVVGLSLLSCEDVIEMRPDPVTGEEYFPLGLGQVRVFAIDSIIFDDAPGGNAKDTISLFIMERVIEAYVSEEENGDSVYVIERAQRSGPQDPWETTDLWLASRSSTEAIRVEENQRYLKLRFPVKVDQEWHSLAYIDDEQEVMIGTEIVEMFKNWESTILGLNQSEIIGQFEFDNSVLYCTHANDDNEIERRFVEEKYAKGIGLVFRKDSILDSRCKRLGTLEPCLVIDNSVTPPDTMSMPWIDKAEKGYIMVQHLIHYE